MINLDNLDSINNTKPHTKNFKNITKSNEADPISLYNQTHILHAIDAMRYDNKQLVMVSDYHIKDDLTGANIHFSNGFFEIDMDGSVLEFKTKYTPFMLFSKFSFGGNHRAAYEWIVFHILAKNVEYMRVGSSYFKKITSKDRFGIERLEVRGWKKEEIIQDNQKKYIDYLPRFDNFIIEPNNCHFKEVIGTSYNLYSKFSHEPKEGSIKWTNVIMEHIFGEQLQMGYKYLKCLYQHPKQILPILVLASQTRETGKSTFLNWLNQIFGANMVVINPDDIMSSFNSSFAKANIIALEETVSDKSTTVEKLKSLSTQKFINMNQKFVDNYKLPFFGKFIITTNDERKFLKVDEDEIRFWVRQIPTPKIKETNIEEFLISEIPSFLYYLKSLPDIDFKKSRMVFTVDELHTDGLANVKTESKPSVYKDLVILLDEYFRENTEHNEVNFTAMELKNKYYSSNQQIGVHYISTILRDHFKISPNQSPCYKTNIFGDYKSGRYFTLQKSYLGEVVENEQVAENNPF